MITEGLDGKCHDFRGHLAHNRVRGEMGTGGGSLDGS